MKILCKVVLAIVIFSLSIVIDLSAQTLTTLINFNGANGANPTYAALVQGTDGNLYGTTYAGGAYGFGTVFKVTQTGSLMRLHSFCAQTNCPDGANPESGLVQGVDGDFYGTTLYGGTGSGTVFKITPGGSLTTLHSFCASAQCADGSQPFGGLVQGTDTNFYGTTSGGGANSSGTVFKLTSAGILTTLYNFCSQFNCADGELPFSQLTQGRDGQFYGTTYGSFDSRFGTVFKISSTGTLTTLHNFCTQANCADGAFPISGLVQYADGNFYGTTSAGGLGGANLYGTVFKITPTGKLTTLYSFCAQANCSDGVYPYAALVQGTDGNFYGTTASGGGTVGCGGFLDSCGTLFTVSPTGTLTTLKSFDSGGSDGALPIAGLVQATNGSFDGTTIIGGDSDDGTIFRLGMGLSPFVKTRPTSGSVGTKVALLGINLAGTTSVTFNGSEAPFTIISNSEIETTVPAGATTGKVSVETPERTLLSNVAFRVKH